MNIGRATTQGAENFIAVHPWTALTLRGGYTYTAAFDDIAQQELLRRPKHKASLSGIWQATPKQAAEKPSFVPGIIVIPSW